MVGLPEWVVGHGGFTRVRVGGFSGWKTGGFHGWKMVVKVCIIKHEPALLVIFSLTISIHMVSWICQLYRGTNNTVTGNTMVNDGQGYRVTHCHVIIGDFHMIKKR